MSPATSRAIVDAQREYVPEIMHNRGFPRKKGHVPRREVCVLKHLRRSDWAPELVWWNTTSMVTTYAGRPLDVFNIPLAKLRG